MIPKKLSGPVWCDSDAPTVETDQGVYRGACVEGVFTFRGIPYAESTRFGMPEPPKKHEGILPALNYGQNCFEVATELPEKKGFTVPSWWYSQGEHCQNLDIWSRSRDGVCPVLVWINAGPNYYACDGSELAATADAVVVTVHIRHGVLGFLDLSGSGFEHSGSAGLADAIAALRWLKRNVGAFGGDAEKIMIIGANGNFDIATAMLQCPLSKGLFRACCVSDVDEASAAGVSREDAAQMTRLVLGQLGASAGKVGSIPFYRLARAVVQAEAIWQAEYGCTYSWQPVIEAPYFRGHPFHSGFCPDTLDVALVTGCAMGGERAAIWSTPLENGASSHMLAWTPEMVQAGMMSVFGTSAPRAAKCFETAFPGRAPAEALFTDYRRRAYALRFSMKRAAATDAPVFNWYFTQRLPADGGTTPWTETAVAFFFHNALRMEAACLPGKTEPIQDVLSCALRRIASGDLPENWPKLQKGLPVPTLWLDDIIAVRCGADLELLRAAGVMPPAPTGKIGGGPRAER